MLPARLTIYPPFYTDHGLGLDLGERVFIDQGCAFLDDAGTRLGDRVMVTGAPIDVAENVWIGAGDSLRRVSASAVA
jgi:hypothetical protein